MHNGTQKRNFGLDLARAIAITMVYFSHGVTALRPLGIGVDLFFLLSGFLIGRIYFRATAEDDFTLLRFWEARWWRTLPPYYAALLLYALLNLKFPGNPIHTYYLIFAQNYVGMTGFGPSWSLCVEEHFYLMLPVLGWLIQRTLGRRSFLWVLPLAALIPQAFRLGYLLLGTLPPNYYFMTHFHAEGLVIGVFLAFLYIDHPDLWARSRAVAIPLTLIVPALLMLTLVHPINSMKLHGGIFLYWALGFAGCLRLAYDLKWEPTLSIGKLAKNAVHGLALCSYSIYLVHTVLFTDIRDVVDAWPRGPLKSGFIMLSTFALSLVFYFLVERPTIHFRDKLLKGRVPEPQGHLPPSSNELQVQELSPSEDLPSDEASLDYPS